MSRSSLLLAGAAALLLLMPNQAEAQRVKQPNRVRKAPVKRSTVRTRHQVRPRSNMRLTKKRSLTKSKTRLAMKNQRTKRAFRPRVQRRRTRLAISHLNRTDRKRVMKLLSSKRLRGNPSARSLVAQYLKLHAKTKGKNMPMSLRQLERIATSGRWSPKQMSNLSKVLRLANYYAKSGKMSPKAAWAKALKAAGIYKKVKSGTCKV